MQPVQQDVCNWKSVNETSENTLATRGDNAPGWVMNGICSCDDE